MVTSVNLNDFLFPAKLLYNLLVVLASFTQAEIVYHMHTYIFPYSSYKVRNCK